MRPRFNFAEAQVKNVKTDAIWQPTRHRQLVVAMYGGSYVFFFFLLICSNRKLYYIKTISLLPWHYATIFLS